MKVNTSYSIYGSSMPPQKVASSVKLGKDGKVTEWGKASVNSVINMSSANSSGRSSKENMRVNYGVYNSDFSEEDFEHILDPYGTKEKWGESPSEMQMYNILRSKIELLKGEEIKRPFKFFAKGVNGEVVTAKEEMRRKAIYSMLMDYVQESLGTREETDENGQPVPPQTPSQVQKYIETQLIDPREVVANQLLEYLTYNLHLEMKFNQGWEHALVGSEEIYYIGVHNNEPVFEVVNPLDFDFDKDSDATFIDESQWCKRERYLTIGTVIDLHGDKLSDADLDRLDRGELGGSYNGYGAQPGFAYTQDALNSQDRFRPTNAINVVHVCWKSMKKIGFLKYINPETGQPEESIVDDSFTLDKEMKEEGATITWQWINEIWEGTRIGGDIYVDVRPLPNQYRSMSNPGECYMPYTGYIYNHVNSEAKSLVDLCKPHQYMYMVVWWRLSNELAKAKGKKFIMDLSMLPKSQGWDMDQWLYYFDNIGVAFINSMEEGRPGDPNSVSKFNQFTDIDMSLSQVVGQYMEILNKLEQQVANITGVTAQREGQIMASETVGGVERSNYQSSHITEPYFYYHNLVKQRAYTRLLEVAKIAYMDGTKKHYIVDDVYTVMMNMPEGMLMDSDLGVFVTNASKDHQHKEKLEALAQVALQQDKASLSDIVKIYKSKSISEIESQIVASENAKYERDSQAQQQQMQAQQKIEAERLAFEREKMDRDDLNKQLDREAALEREQLKALGNAENTDMNNNGIPDVTEYTQLALDHQHMEFEKGQKMRELSIKQQESEAKRQKNDADIAKMQRELDLKQKQLDMSMQSLKADNAKFTREQNQQDKKNAADLKMKMLELKQKEADRKLKMKELALKERMAKDKHKADMAKAKAIKNKPKTK
jgi:hypothetical protein